ncbi:MAG: 3-hydroxyanthranilate 3,4-dioxygenase [Myxococcales bacterium]|nr:3-hydroxyanthranilate 3,4-dioxygenase [Myxococcales bacterium]
MRTPAPFDLRRFIDERRDELRPPVGNARVFEDGDFIIMVVGGPNDRRDYHIDPGDELFYQLEGDITLKVFDADGPRDVTIREGQVFLLPAGIPHSPQRGPDTVGLVIERRRQPGEVDSLRWYCDGCGAITHEYTFQLADITTELAAAIARVKENASLRTCKACGAVSAP